MATLFLTCVLHCCTRVEMEHKDIWDQHDTQALMTAQDGCRADKAGKGNPCLVEFIKVEESIYNALCGKNNN